MNRISVRCRWQGIGERKEVFIVDAYMDGWNKLNPETAQVSYISDFKTAQVSYEQFWSERNQYRFQSQSFEIIIRSELQNI